MKRFFSILLATIIPFTTAHAAGSAGKEFNTRVQVELKVGQHQTRIANTRQEVNLAKIGYKQDFGIGESPFTVGVRAELGQSKRKKGAKITTQDYAVTGAYHHDFGDFGKISPRIGLGYAKDTVKHNELGKSSLHHSYAEIGVGGRFVLSEKIRFTPDFSFQKDLKVSSNQDKGETFTAELGFSFTDGDYRRNSHNKEWRIAPYFKRYNFDTPAGAAKQQEIGIAASMNLD